MIPTTVAPGHWLDAPAAAAYQRARAAGCPAGITDAGRSPERQAAMYATWLAERHLPVSKRTYKAGVAAPGTSDHERGRALDVPSAVADWFRAHPDYGWIADTIKSEPWHVVYMPGRDRHAQEVPTMRIIRGVERPEVWATNGITKRHIASQVELQEELRVWGQAEPMVVGQFYCDRIPVYTPAGPVDVQALAAAVASRIPAGGDPDALATALAAELARRLTS